MQPAPPKRSMFTPAIYAALLALVGLTIVTVPRLDRVELIGQ